MTPIPNDRTTIGGLMGLVGLLSLLLLLVEASHREAAEALHGGQAEQVRLQIQRSRDIEAMDAEVRACEAMTYSWDAALVDPTWSRRMIPRLQDRLAGHERAAERREFLSAPRPLISP